LRSDRQKHLSYRLSAVFLAVFLLCILYMPAAALAGESPLPPGDAWAADRPDDNGGKVDLGWTASPSPDIAAYRVYRAQQTGGPYGMLSERRTDSAVDYLGYVDTGLADGTTYYYVVTAVDGQGRESAFSPELSATPCAQIFEAAVTIQKNMVLSIADQRLYCLENGRLVHMLIVSTGAGGTPTPTGNFRILYHDQAHVVPKYPGCVCYYWMGFFEDYAIHAWPTYNGVQSNYEGLGYPASHGCVRLDPTQAHVPFYWAPDGTPLSIIPGPFQPPPAPIQGGTVSKGVAEAATSWYFAEGYTGEGFDEYILIQNPNPEGAILTLDYLKPDGSVYSQGYLLGANTRTTVLVDAAPGMDSTDVSVRLDSSLPVVAERSMYFNYRGKTGGHVSLGVTSPARKWFFAEGSTGDGFDEYVLILNPQATGARVTLDYLKPDGSVSSQEITVGANSRATVAVDDAPGMGSTDVSVRLGSDIPVVAERAMYFGYHGIDGGHVSSGSSEPSPQWYFAEGYTAGAFDEYILVLNPEAHDALVTLDYLKSDGSVTRQDIVVGANSRATVAVDAVPGMESADVSVYLHSNRPVMAERAMYFAYQDCPGGHVQTGYNEPGQLFFMAEGYTSPFFDTFLMVMNPNDTELNVAFSFRKPDGNLVTWPLQVGAHSRGTLKVNSIPYLTDSEFSIRVDTDLPAVVERAMYFNYPR
jgi:hypothetical protein